MPRASTPSFNVALEGFGAPMHILELRRANSSCSRERWNLRRIKSHPHLLVDQAQVSVLESQKRTEGERPELVTDVGD